MRSCSMFAAFWGLLVLGTASAIADETLRTITVTGEGEVSAPPDMATVNAGVVTQAQTAKEALEKNTEAMETIMQALKKHGIARKDLQTSSFNVQPLYDRDERGRQKNEITGYQVRNQLRVRIRNLADLGELLDALVQSESNQISGISFGVDDATGILNQARSRALQDAKQRAEVYAQAAGVEVGDVLHISEQPIATPRPLQLGFARAQAASVPVAAGEQEFRVTVNVVYKIEDDE